MVAIRSKAPLRVSFAGGGTDVSPFPEERGGAVLNATIDRYAYATVQTRDGNNGGVRVESLDFNVTTEFQKPSDLVYNGELDLVKAALKVLHGAPASAGGIRLFLHSDAPSGAGLGGSSTMTVAIVGALLRHLREPSTPYEIAELAYCIEREELGWKGGRQDQYAAAFGGFNFIEFSAKGTVVNPLRIPVDLSNELAYRLLLVYTGTSHFSHDIIERQQSNYSGGRTSTVEALEGTKRLAIEMKNQLLRGQLDEMGKLLDEGWQLKKRFTDGISNPQIDRMYTAAKAAGALGGKLTGAGGGGHILLFCDYERRASVAKAVSELGGRVTSFQLEPNGLQTWAVK